MASKARSLRSMGSKVRQDEDLEQDEAEDEQAPPLSSTGSAGRPSPCVRTAGTSLTYRPMRVQGTPEAIGREPGMSQRTLEKHLTAPAQAVYSGEQLDPEEANENDAEMPQSSAKALLPLVSASSGVATDTLRRPLLARRRDHSGVTTAPSPQTGLYSLLQQGYADQAQTPADSNTPSNDEGAFESFFDLTHERLQHIFDTFDKDNDEKVSYKDLREGLLRWVGLSIPEDPNFENFVKTLDADGSGDISFREFESGLRELMMNILFNDTSLAGASDKIIAPLLTDALHVELAPLHVIDYDALQHTPRMFSTEQEMRQFMYGQRELGLQCRWIDAYGGTADRGRCDVEGSLTLKRLAVKYQLHPLALEDALLTEELRPKLDRYTTHYFMVVPFFTWKTHRNIGHPAALNVYTEYICIFVTLPSYDTLITFQRQDGNHRERWKTVLRDLEKAYSKLRQYDVQYLAYVIVDTLVDRLFPMVRDFKKALDHEQERLRRTAFEDTSAVGDMGLQLQDVLRKMRPLLRLLTHIIEDVEFCDGVTLYLRDVRDNVEAVDDDLRSLIGRCESMENESEKFHDAQMETTLYRLSVCSMVFLPAQFLTGVWGMNFDNMPELHWKYGYTAFWALSVCFFVIVGWCLRFGQKPT